jgi:hypothetical protein
MSLASGRERCKWMGKMTQSLLTPFFIKMETNCQEALDQTRASKTRFKAGKSRVTI